MSMQSVLNSFFQFKIGTMQNPQGFVYVLGSSNEATRKKEYKKIYKLGTKMPKQNKLGIHMIIEEYALSILTLLIDSVQRRRQEKARTLNQDRRDSEVLKHLIRFEYELSIIKEKSYINMSHMLENISMMTTGWIKSLGTQKPLY